MSKLYVGHVADLRRLLGNSVQISDVDSVLEARGVPKSVVVVCDMLDSDSDLSILLAHLRNLRDDLECLLTCKDQLTRELAPAEETAVLADTDDLVPTQDDKGQPTLQWYHSVLRHALGSAHPSKALVLWGPPGIGKTLTMSRVERMLQRQAAERLGGQAKATGRLMVNDARLGAQAQAILLSCASVDDESGVNDLLEQARAFCASARPESVLMIDDFDALLDGRAQEALLACVLKARCRVVLACNDFFATGCRKLSEKRAQLSAVQVKRAHPGKLAEHLVRRFGLTHQNAADIAAQAVGDVRQAETHARLNLCTAQSDNEHSVSEAPSVSLLRCAQARQPLEELRAAHWDRAADSAELMFTNAPRYSSGQRPMSDADRIGAAHALAEMQEFASLADVYECARRMNGYSDADGVQTDKNLHFALALESPLILLKQQVALRGNRLALYPLMDFSARRIGRTASEHAESLRAAHVRADLVARSGFEAAARQIASADGRAHNKTDHGVSTKSSITGAQVDGTVACTRWQPLLAAFTGPNELRDALVAIQKKKTGADDAALIHKLECVIQQFAANGHTGTDFARACRYTATMAPWQSEWPTMAVIRRVFDRCKPKLAYDDSVLGLTVTKRKIAPRKTPTKRARKAGPAHLLDQYFKK